MKVLYLTPQPLEAGRFTSVSFLEEEVRALADRGLSVHLLSESGEAPPTDPGGRSIRAHAVPSGRRMGELAGTAAFALRTLGTSGAGPRGADLRTRIHFRRLEKAAAEVIRREGIDVIHSHFGWPGGWGGVLASRSTGVPLVATFRGMDLNLKPDFRYGLRQDPHFRGALPVLLRHAPITAYPSEYMRTMGVALGADPARTRIVRQGVDPDRFRPATDRAALRKALGIPGDTGTDPLLLSVGMLVRHKGVHHTLEALARLEPVHRPRLVVCGEGPELERLRADATRLGIGDRVHFAGYVGREEIPKYFAAADLFVHSAHFEAAGNVLMEAMAAGRAVVCTDAGGPAEYVIDGETGLVVPPAEPDALASALRRLLDRPDRADRMGERGRARVENHLRYDRMLDRIVAVYREAVEGASGKG